MNKSKLPDGMMWFYDPFINEWVIRLQKGFSNKYLTINTFIPMREFNATDSVEKKGRGNFNLHDAKREKNDEYYTPFDAIVDELKHYKSFFKDKIVYCPCDKAFNTGRSNFVEYFISNFHALGIKKLICTQYNPNGVGEVTEYNLFGEKQNEWLLNGIKWEYVGQYDDDTHIDESKINTYLLKGNGSYDSIECKEIMKQCDIVVTNPPFSKFRGFINQIMKYDKKFLIIGNKNCLSYKDVFTYIQNNQMWLGYSVPKDYITPSGETVSKINGLTRWFTNIDHSKRHDTICCIKKYNQNDYPKYDNYDAINVADVKSIPDEDYDGVMGVPITFLDKYCPEQFEILGLSASAGYDRDVVGIDFKGEKDARPIINGKVIYARIFIKHKRK